MRNPDRFKVGCIWITLGDEQSFFFEAFLDRDCSVIATSDDPVLFPYSQALEISRTIRSHYPFYSVEVVGIG